MAARFRSNLPSKHGSESLASLISSLPVAQRERILSRLSDDEIKYLRWDWRFWARPKQLPPPDAQWLIWLLMTGRGFGKTRSGAEWVIERARDGNADRWIALIGSTPKDVRDFQIERGPSSILKVSPPWFMPIYYPSRRLLLWPNGAHATVYSAEKPDQVRGFSGDSAWIDEWAKFRSPQEVLDNLLFGLREAKVSEPRICITTTPKPLEALKELVAEEDTRVVTGTSYENRENLAPRWYKMILTRYEGTAIGEQEILGRLLDQMPGALWQRSWIDAHRDRSGKRPDGMQRIVVAVDPPGSSKRKAAEAGIVVAGVRNVANVPHFHVLADLSLRGTPKDWGAAAVDAYHDWQADAIVGEVNYGGEMVENTIRTVPRGRDVAFIYANATRGKEVRAQPVSSLYEQGRGHHCGTFPKLEDELCTWEPMAQPPMPSPNRLDALVWTAYALILGPTQETEIEIPALMRGGH